jgi:hypothetical protein
MEEIAMIGGMIGTVSCKDFGEAVYALYKVTIRSVGVIFGYGNGGSEYYIIAKGFTDAEHMLVEAFGPTTSIDIISIERITNQMYADVAHIGDKVDKENVALIINEKCHLLF